MTAFGPRFQNVERGFSHVVNAGELAGFLVVDDEDIDAPKERFERLRLTLDPEVHRVGQDELRRLDAVENLGLESRVDVAEEHDRRTPKRFRDLRLEAGEHVELRVERRPASEVGIVATCPAKRLSARALDALDGDAARLQLRQRLLGKVVPDDGDETRLRAERGCSERRVGRRPPDGVRERSVRELEVIERHRADDEDGSTGHGRRSFLSFEVIRGRDQAGFASWSMLSQRRAWRGRLHRSASTMPRSFSCALEMSSLTTT